MRKLHNDSKKPIVESIIAIVGYLDWRVLLFSRAYHTKRRCQYEQITSCKQKTLKFVILLFSENSYKFKVEKTTTVINNQSERYYKPLK